MTYRDKNDLTGTMRRLGICVLIPTYNNAGTLGLVVSDVLNYSDDVIVVNDGSTDDTLSVLQEFEQRITIVSYVKNRGKGYALKTGFYKARELGYKYAITLDSDGQHYASDIPHFVKAIAENREAIIVGERDLTRVDINARSSFANKFSNFWFCVQTGRNLKDTQTGFRAYPLDDLYGLSLLTSRYEAELELLVFASWNGVNIVSIPINVYYPPKSERVSHFRPGPDFIRISILNTILCIVAIVYGIPARLWNSISKKRILSYEFKFFTHKKGIRKEAATTIDRFLRSIYGLSFFVFCSQTMIIPLAWLNLRYRKDDNLRKLKFHKMLQGISTYITTHLPGCPSVIINHANETFEEPAVIVCNHQSHLDLTTLITIHPKLIFLTNNWVWNNFFIRRIVRTAEFLPVSAGMDKILPHLKNLRDRGYSIVVFPEGTRSENCAILRFHQGAFLLAKELEMDIIPLVLHGAGHFLPKKDFMFRRGRISLDILPRVEHTSIDELTMLQRASLFRKIITKQYALAAYQKENASYFESLVLYKYAYRGWGNVSRCKNTLLNLRAFHEIINRRVYNKVRIINSGIGTFALLFALVNKDAEIEAFEGVSMDYEAAVTTPNIPENLRFIHAVWDSELSSGDDYDITIILGGDEFMALGNIINLPITS